MPKTNTHVCRITSKETTLPQHYAFCPHCGWQADGGKPYSQGFNPTTGDVLVIFTVEDIQAAAADHTACDGQEDECKSVTISPADALRFLEQHDDEIVDAILCDWAITVQSVYSATEFQAPKETNFND